MISLKSLKKVLRRSQTAPQVKDEVAILNDSLRQLESVDALYHPGPYWLRHQQPLVKHIRESGLENFRSGTLDRKDPAYIFRRFGAAEPHVESPSPELSQEQWNRQRYETAAEYGRSKGAKPLSSVSVSLIGAPGDAFEVDGNNYTHLALNCYMRYAYLSQFLEFEKVNNLVEIGPGSGLQTEILHQLYPHLTSFLFDIPPQSYVCNQYLKAVFKDKVLPLQETAELDKLPSVGAGTICMFNSWQIPLVAGSPIDLFWNAASFNEMQPHLVDNYLSFVRPTAKSIYLMSIMEGSNVGLADYERFLPHHRCQDVSPLPLPTGELSQQYRNSLWTRQPA